MHWKTKAAFFRVLERVPFGDDLHYLAQRHVTRSWPRPEGTVSALITAATKHMEDFRRVSHKPLDRSIFFEIGAGRDLIVPVVLRLMGVKAVITLDINRLAKLDLVNSAARTISRHLGKPVPDFRTWADLEGFGVTYLAPFDAAKDDIPLIDAFISNEVLEHIPPVALSGVLDNVAKSMVEGGLSIHSVDYSDHYARDAGVSRYNFLQFSDEEWKPFNSGLHYVNRMRHSQYIKMFENAGLRTVEAETHEGEFPPNLKIAERFTGFSQDDLRITRSRIISVKSRI